ncbi:MAG: phosphoribosylglycinamide formyltransferase [Clostridia bacterium]|nr:phosphoribosylglycinamide formyltransferase [Clostridia bacterium]MBQ5760931.1 phosphoribosylglycinamide formyltransferase [Clostridia bacterium]
MVKIAVFVSGGGTNLQALIDCWKTEGLGGGEITAVVSSKKSAYALERAANAGIPGYFVSGKGLSVEEYSQKLDELLEEKIQPDLIVLAGFLKIFSADFCKKYSGRIINVHPSLIPAFCGDGMYGLHVHEAALQKGVKVSGATVHFVDAVTDGGPIILQKAVEVMQGDTPETLQQRIMEQCEWKLMPQAVSLFCQGKLHIEGDHVIIKE